MLAFATAILYVCVSSVYLTNVVYRVTGCSCVLEVHATVLSLMDIVLPDHRKEHHHRVSRDISEEIVGCA